MNIITRILTPAGEKVAIYNYGQRSHLDDVLAEWRVRYQFGSCYLDYHATDFGCYEDGESVNNYRNYRELTVTVVTDLVSIHVDEAYTLRVGRLLDDLENYPDRLLLHKDRYRVQRTPIGECSVIADTWYEEDGYRYRDVPVIVSEVPVKIRVLIRGLAHQLAEILHPRDVGGLKDLLVYNGDLT